VGHRGSRHLNAVLFFLVVAAVTGALAARSRAVPGDTGARPAADVALRASTGQATPAPLTVTSRKYSFSPARIEVHVDDLVKIRFEAEDIPHSFTLDAYRIAKRASPGHPAVFEFRADRAGTFPFYCDLSLDDGCRQMRGELIVHPRKP